MNISGYKIEKRIGRGGMANVYLAIQESLDRPVALKILSPHHADSEEFSKRFLNEGKMLASLRHTNIITVFDFNIHEGLHYICMEYVEGKDLKSRIREGVKPGTALYYIETLAHSLQVAHKQNIVHRDIKPANVMFREDGTLLLTDFGIAKQLDETSDLTVTGSTLGTPHYLSPEQAQAKPVDLRADIYSLGIILFEMLVGQRPYQGDSDLSTALKHVTDPIPDLPDELKAFQPLLNKMIAKAPSDRFNNVTELIDAVREFRSDEEELLRKLDAVESHPASRYQTQARACAALEETISVAGSQKTQATISATAESTEAAEQGAQPPLAQNLESEHALTSASSIFPAAGNDDTTQVAAPPQEKKARTVSFSGAAAILVVLMIPAIYLWMTRTTDAPIDTPNAVTHDEPAPSVGQRAQLAPDMAQGTHHPPSITETKTPPAKESTVARASAPPETGAGSERQQEIDDLLAQAQSAINEFRLTKPDNNNALAYFQQVLAIDPQNEQARAGPASIAVKYGELAQTQIDRRRYSKANEYIDKGLQVDPANGTLLALQAKAVAPKAPAARKREYREETPKELYERVKRFFN